MPVNHQPKLHASGVSAGACTIVSNRPIARDTWQVRLEVPEIAHRIQPGQFVMVRIAGADDPLLGRPLALYDTYVGVDGSRLGIDLVYRVAGKLTRRLADMVMGQRLDVWGPLGNGFGRTTCSRLYLVAGGIGQTPFLSVAQDALGAKGYGARPAEVWARDVCFVYGARSAEYLAGLNDFRRAGVHLKVATDDGSEGFRGFVTELLRELLRAEDPSETRVMCCGPEPMMLATAKICAAGGVACDVSLETPMACGIGACFTCVARIRESGSTAWDYRRTCVEGPVFDANRVAWD